MALAIVLHSAHEILWKITHAQLVLEDVPSFADDIDELARYEEDLVHCLDETSSTYGMEISAEKTKLMTNNNER